MANPVIRLKRGTSQALAANSVLSEITAGEMVINTTSKMLYVSNADNSYFVLKPQPTVIVVSDTPNTAAFAPPQGGPYSGTIKPANTFTEDRTFLLPDSNGTILTTGNIGSVITNAILNAISNAVAVVTENSPFITNLSLNSNGELVAVYSNNTSSVIGDVVELDQPLDGGTF